MNVRESFSNSTYEEATRLAERELFSFVAAVTRLFGPEEAKVAADYLARRIGDCGQPASVQRSRLALCYDAASARL